MYQQSFHLIKLIVLEQRKLWKIANMKIQMIVVQMKELEWFVRRIWVLYEISKFSPTIYINSLVSSGVTKIKYPVGIGI